MIHILKLILFYLIIYLTCIVVFMFFDHTNWNGLNKKNDSTFNQKLIGYF